MTTPFGPQLIGETEKTLNALLLRVLDGTGLTEPQWVTLRVAAMLDGTVDADELAAAVADRAQFTDATHLVAVLTETGMLEDGHLTAQGRAQFDALQAAVTARATTIFTDLPADDVAATTRVLNEVVERARVALAS
jgi:hypothetical protein